MKKFLSAILDWAVTTQYEDLSLEIQCPSCGEMMSLYSMNEETGAMLGECGHCDTTVQAKAKCTLEIVDVFKFDGE